MREPDDAGAGPASSASSALSASSKPDAVELLRRAREARLDYQVREQIFTKWMIEREDVARQLYIESRPRGANRRNAQPELKQLAEAIGMSVAWYKNALRRPMGTCERTLPPSEMSSIYLY